MMIAAEVGHWGLGEVYSKVIEHCGGQKQLRLATGVWGRFIQRLSSTAGDRSS